MRQAIDPPTGWRITKLPNGERRGYQVEKQLPNGDWRPIKIAFNWRPAAMNYILREMHSKQTAAVA